MALDAYQGYRLHRATLLNVIAIWRLEKEIFPKDAYSIPELGIQFCLPRSRNYRLVSSNGEVAGFVSGMHPWFPKHPAWVVTIGVAKDHQRQGLGTFLLDWIERRLQNSRIRLTVRASNAAAISLYDTAGYVYLRRLYRYYMDGEDGLLMEKIRDD